MSVIVCIAGGGTGGHLMPALALADALRARWPKLSVQFIGAKRGLEAELLPQRGEKVLLLAMHAVSGAGLLQRLRALLLELPKAVWSILRHWRGQRPVLVIGVGGYASAMGVAAALCARVPVLLYEQNAIPGMVNRQLARFCQKVLLGMSAAADYLPHVATVVCGNLVRSAVAQTAWRSHAIPQLLVLGGSQGARFLNTTMPQVAARLQQQGGAFSVRHQCGKGNEDAVTEAYRAAGVNAVVEPFCQQMDDFYSSGDLLVARAGAMTVAECQAVGMPALFIPLPIAADDHQYHNAMALHKVGAAKVLRQEAASVDALMVMVVRLLFDTKQLQTMSTAARLHAPVDAATTMLDAIAPWLPVEAAS